MNVRHSRWAKAATAAALLAAGVTVATTSEDAEAFCSTEVMINACLDGTWGHEALTEQGLPFLNSGALDEMNDEHEWVDTNALTSAINHFDDCLFQESAAEINDQYFESATLNAGGVLEELDPTDPEPLDAADEFGQMLHIAQDFYSHSNWVELGRDDLFESGTGKWSVTDDWQVLRDDIAIMGRPTPADWTIVNSGAVPELTRPDGTKLRGLVSGVNENTLESDNGCAEESAFEHGDAHEGLNKDRDVAAKPLWKPAFDLAKRQTAHEWCRLQHLLDAEYGAAGPATAMGLWLSNTGSPHPDGTPCASAPAGPVKVTAKATGVQILDNMDGADAEINTRLILFGRDLRQSVRSQSPRVTGVDEDETVTTPPAVSFCVDATDELAVTIQGWDDDDEGDGPDSVGIPGQFDAVGNDDDDALAGVTKSLGQASDAANPYSGSSEDMNASFQIDVSTDDADQDGLTDCDETDTYKTLPDDPDSDEDGLTDGAEVNEHKTDPNKRDTDADGLDDGTEVTMGTNPLAADSDGDGLDDGPEVNTYETDPDDPDSDDDGLDDGAEVNMHKTDPNDPDSDDDGLDDGAEVNSHSTDPNDPDSDDDGLTDGIEVEYGTDPSIADSDGDGLLDGSDVEFVQNAVAALADADFKSQAGGSQQAVAAILDAVEQQLLSGSADGAVNKLENLRKHLDGCGTGPDKDDWIIACQSQTEIRALVDTLIANVGA